VNEARGLLGNPEDEFQPLEAVSRRLVKTVTEDNSVRLCV
jgi:hypothetical protein